MVPGNHEFDFGPEVFRDAHRRGEVPDRRRATSARPTAAAPAEHRRRRRSSRSSGVKIGFYGLTTEDTPVVSSPGDITFAPSVETGIAQGRGAPRGRAPTSSSRSSTRRSMSTSAWSAPAPPTSILSGHDEHLLTFFNGKTALTESESQGELRRRHRDHASTRTEKDGKVAVAWRPAFRIVDTADRRARRRDRRAGRELQRQARRGAQGRDRHDRDAARQPPRHGARRGGGDRQPDRRRDARGGRRRRRDHQWRRHPRRQGISGRDRSSPAATSSPSCPSATGR